MPYYQPIIQPFLFTKTNSYYVRTSINFLCDVHKLQQVVSYLHSLLESSCDKTFSYYCTYGWINFSEKISRFCEFCSILKISTTKIFKTLLYQWYRRNYTGINPINDAFEDLYELAKLDDLFSQSILSSSTLAANKRLSEVEW